MATATVSSAPRMATASSSNTASRSAASWRGRSRAACTCSQPSRSGSDAAGGAVTVRTCADSNAASARCSQWITSAGLTSASTSPERKADAAVWLSGPGSSPVTASTTRGPANPTIAPSTAQRRSARLPKVTQTPPVVGWSATADVRDSRLGQPVDTDRGACHADEAGDALLEPGAAAAQQRDQRPARPYRGIHRGKERSRVEFPEAAAEHVEVPADDDHGARAHGRASPAHRTAGHVARPVHPVDGRLRGLGGPVDARQERLAPISVRPGHPGHRAPLRRPLPRQHSDQT